MPRPTHRIDLVVVPAVPDAHPIEAASALVAELREVGICDSDGAPGPAAARWLPGGFGRLWLDDPGRTTLYANRLGGFRVRCPSTGRSVVPAFQDAMTRWREGRGERRLVCPACAADHPLEVLDCAPPAAFARVALVTADAAAIELTAEALARIENHLGPAKVVIRRG